jgi:glycosyltransferase involved in cell wall biosynthesis
MVTVPKGVMKVWIVNPYGTLPSEGWREYRSSMLAKALASRGHEVTWWISDFEHRSKSFRACGVLHDSLLPRGVRVVGVRSSPYKRNISLQRIRYEMNYGSELARLAEKEPIPDLIVLGDPALFFAPPVVAYRDKVGCKLIVDVIDLWPELFSVTLPKLLQPFSRFIFSPLYKRREKLIETCDAVVAVSNDYLDTVLRTQTKNIPRQVAYLGIDLEKQRVLPFNSSLNEKLRAFKSRFALTAVYAGTLGDAYDMDLLLNAVRQIDAQDRDVQFLIAGDGPRKADIIAAAKRHPDSLLFLGALPSDDLKTLYANADVGLMTYLPGSTVAMPVKFFDYLSGGLAVLSSLERDVRQAIDEHKVGLSYQPSNLEDLLRCISVFKNDPEKLLKTRCFSRKLATAYDATVQHKIFSEFIEKCQSNSFTNKI